MKISCPICEKYWSMFLYSKILFLVGVCFSIICIDFFVSFVGVVLLLGFVLLLLFLSLRFFVCLFMCVFVFQFLFHFVSNRLFYLADIVIRTVWFPPQIFNILSLKFSDVYNLKMSCPMFEHCQVYTQKNKKKNVVFSYFYSRKTIQY